jgi:hypothetical protein
MLTQDTLCFSEAYGMRPTYKEKKNAHALAPAERTGNDPKDPNTRKTDRVEGGEVLVRAHPGRKAGEERKQQQSHTQTISTGPQE